MTRNEAKDRVFLPKWLEPKYYLDYKETFISTLENLGLIKLDEEIIFNPSIIIKDELNNEFDNPVSYIVRADRIVNALYKAGYKIVRKDKAW